MSGKTSAMKLEMEKSIEYMRSRIKKLEKKMKEPHRDANDLKGLEGMIQIAKDSIADYEEFEKTGFVGLNAVNTLNAHHREVITEFLFENGFELTYARYNKMQQPELRYNGKNRQLRVRVNYGGIILLLDPNCTMQITIGKWFYSPNQGRFDWTSGSIEEMKETIKYYMKRADEKEYDIQCIEKCLSGAKNSYKQSVLQQNGY